jgi:hypothetical protein
VAIYYMPGGCACHTDKLQALCEQHISKARPIDGMRLVALPLGVAMKEDDYDGNALPI